MISKEDKEYIQELHEEYDVPYYVISALIDMMGMEELRDGITTAIADDWDIFRDMM